jgi:hypothetical protein
MTFLADFIRETATIDVTVACLLFIILCPGIIIHLPFSNITNVTILSVVFFIIYAALRARFDLSGCLVDDRMIESIVDDDYTAGSFFSPKYAATTKDRAPTHVSPRLHPPRAAAHIHIDGLSDLVPPKDTTEHSPTSTTNNLPPHDNIPHDNIPHDNIPHDNIPHDNIPHGNVFPDDDLPEECSPVVHEDFQKNFTQDVDVGDESPPPVKGTTGNHIVESSDDANW